MTQPTGVMPRHLKVVPEAIRLSSGLSAWAGKVTIPVGSTSAFSSVTSITSGAFITSLNLEVGSVGALVGSAIAAVGAQVWPGSGVNFFYQNGVAAMVPVTVHYQFADLV